MEENLILSKVILISGGAVRVPEGYRFPVRMSRSTAGPGAGKRSVVFSFHGMRVKKSISETGEFFFDPDKGLLKKDDRIIADGVSVIPVAFHCPEQAFFNLDQRCKFDCLYCSSPLLKTDATKDLTSEKIVRMIRECREPVLSIALTSGVRNSVKETAERMAKYVSELRKEFPDLPIGVEPYLDDLAQVDLLHEAGANEIKINVETATDELFKIFCPSLDRDNILKMLAHAVEVFGRGKVSSNVIIGLGESDEDVEAIIRRLCSIGVAPTVRGLRLNDDTGPDMKKQGVTDVPSPERLIRIARIQKDIMEEYGLSSETFDTMCLRCTCCDLVPFRDL